MRNNNFENYLTIAINKATGILGDAPTYSAEELTAEMEAKLINLLFKTDFNFCVDHAVQFFDIKDKDIWLKLPAPGFLDIWKGSLREPMLERYDDFINGFIQSNAA